MTLGAKMAPLAAQLTIVRSAPAPGSADWTADSSIEAPTPSLDRFARA